MPVLFARLRPMISDRFMVHGFYYAWHHPFFMNAPENPLFIKTSSRSAKLILQHSKSLAINIFLELLEWCIRKHMSTRRKRIPGRYRSKICIIQWTDDPILRRSIDLHGVLYGSVHPINSCTHIRLVSKITGVVEVIDESI